MDSGRRGGAKEGGPAPGGAEVSGLEAEMAGVEAEVAACRRCPLAEGRVRAVPGEGPAPARVMFVGEAPGEKEDETGRPFVGNAGRVFDKLLAEAGLKREDVFVTGAVKCRPPGNRNPRAGEIEACRPYLERQLAAVRPQVVCAMGRAALRALLGREPPPELSLSRAHGRAVRRDGYWLFPTYHPAAAFYRQELKQALEDDMRRLGGFLRRLDAGDESPDSPGAPGGA